MKVWFKGFSPIAWQGWLVYLMIVGGLIFDFSIIRKTSASTGDALFSFFPHAAIGFLIFSLIVRARRTL